MAPISTGPAGVGVGVAVGTAVGVGVAVGVAVGVTVGTSVGVWVAVGVAIAVGVAVGVFSSLPQANNTGVINASTSNGTVNLYQELLCLCPTTINLLHFYLG